MIQGRHDVKFGNHAAVTNTKLLCTINVGCCPAQTVMFTQGSPPW